MKKLLLVLNAVLLILSLDLIPCTLCKADDESSNLSLLSAQERDYVIRALQTTKAVRAALGYQERIQRILSDDTLRMNNPIWVDYMAEGQLKLFDAFGSLGSYQSAPQSFSEVGSILADVPRLNKGCNVISGKLCQVDRDYRSSYFPFRLIYRFQWSYYLYAEGRYLARIRQLVDKFQASLEKRVDEIAKSNKTDEVFSTPSTNVSQPSAADKPIVLSGGFIIPSSVWSTNTINITVAKPINSYRKVTGTGRATKRDGTDDIQFTFEGMLAEATSGTSSGAKCTISLVRIAQGKKTPYTGECGWGGTLMSNGSFEGEIYPRDYDVYIQPRVFKLTVEGSKPAKSADVKFAFNVTNISGSGQSRTITARVINSGTTDAHNVSVKVEASSKGSKIKLNGQDSVKVDIGTIAAGKTAMTKADISFSTADGLIITMNGIVTFTVTINSDEHVDHITFSQKPE